VWFLVGLLSAGCQGTGLDLPSAVPSSTGGDLIEYRTITPHSPTPTGTPVFAPPVTPAPTATPFTHVVAQGETMLGIALQYAVTLEELQAANLGVDPQFLSVGTGLIIPLEGEILQVVPTATPVETTWHPPICYRTGDDGAWCFLLVENNGSTTLENLSAWIGLYDPAGMVFASQIAVGPLNIIRPGQSMPLVVFFPPPIPAEFTVSGELLTALDLPLEDTRYLDWPIYIEYVEINNGVGISATLAGMIELPEDRTAPGQVWVVAVAYDQDGNVVGMRKWDSEGEQSFEMSVYSLGGAIERVEVLVEIRP